MEHRTLRAFVGHAGHALVMGNERSGGQREIGKPSFGVLRQAA